MQISSFVCAMGSLIVTCLSTASSHSEVMGIQKGRSREQDQADPTPPYDAIFLHFTFMCATCFVLMAFTNWSLDGTPGSFELDRGSTSMWTKMVAQYLSFGLYCWILIAPRIVKGRQFS
jgi:serine incorporator 1/3